MKVFFKSLKKECINRNNYLTRKEAKLSVFQCIEMWYNTNRIHSSLGNKSIKEFAKSNKNNHLAHTLTLTPEFEGKSIMWVV